VLASEDLSSGAAAALDDLERIVESTAATGWRVDRYELEAMMPDALASLCSIPEPDRAALGAAVHARLAALGGPVEEAYRRAGGDLDAVEELLFATRVALLVDEAAARAPRECPFWVLPSPNFRGLQSNTERLTLNLEGGGLLLLHHARDPRGLSFGGGGSGRLLLGYGLDARWTVLGGTEFGGGALFKPQGKTTHLPLQFVAAAPLVLRHHLLTWHHDVEIAPLAFFTEEKGAVSYGARVGAVLGVSGLRVRNVLPWVGVGVAYEIYAKNEVRSWMSQIKGGARIGLDWDF
jgi:hypothetical protein